MLDENALTPKQVAGLIPEYNDLKAKTSDDIVSFGKVAVEGMIGSWKYRINGSKSHLEKLKKLAKFFAKANAKKIKREAAKFENPTFPKIGPFGKERGGIFGDGENEPLDAASINRQRGATTFNVCGWCKHAGCGTCRYNYCISTSCDIISDAGMGRGYEKDKTFFNTPCVIQSFNDAMFDKVREGLAKNIAKTEAAILATQEKIDLLKRLSEKAEKKPALPDHRPCTWFNIDDPIVCFVGKWKEKINQSLLFAKGKVIMGYRHHDGCVSVCFDEKVHAGEYLDGHGGGYGMSRPEIMHEWEFEYLLKHPDFAEVWAGMGAGKNLKDHDKDVFLEALQSIRKSRNIPML